MVMMGRFWAFFFQLRYSIEEKSFADGYILKINTNIYLNASKNQIKIHSIA